MVKKQNCVSHSANIHGLLITSCFNGIFCRSLNKSVVISIFPVAESILTHTLPKCSLITFVKHLCGLPI